MSPPSSASNSPRELKGPPSPAPLSVDTKSYSSNYSSKNLSSNVGGAVHSSTTTSLVGSSMKSPVAKVHSESWSLKPYRREGAIASLKRLSLNSYANPPLKTDEQLSDTEIAAKPPRFSPSAHQPPKGLSPTSLKEIQVELKAVLNSLESFTIQQTRLNNCFPDGAPTTINAAVITAADKFGAKNNSTSTISPPDLVQNLPSYGSDIVGHNARSASLGCVPATPPFENSVQLQMIDTTLAEQFAENKENTLKKNNTFFPSSSLDNGTSPMTTNGDHDHNQRLPKSKPPVPRKPSNSPQSSRRTPNRSIECPNEAKF